MNPDDLARILDELGQRLGPTGEHVFQLAVRQVVIDATLGLAWSIPVLIAVTIATVWGLRLSVRKYRIAKANEPIDYFFPWLFAGMAIFPVGGTAATVLLANLARIANPEYAALRDIIGSLPR